VRTTLTLVAVAALSLAYLGDYFNGHGSWRVLRGGEVTIVDVEGRLMHIPGDFHMGTRELELFRTWLESQGFALNEGDKGTGSSDLTYRGKYQNSLPIEVTIKTSKLEEGPEIALSYEGHGFKRLFDARKKKVGVFSNEMVRVWTQTSF